MEHILEEAVPKVFEDIKSYLEEDGIIFSIAGGPSSRTGPTLMSLNVRSSGGRPASANIGSKFGLAYYP